MEFWNLTSSTITALTLAPAGTSTFGPNQCDNDKDHEVDHDERLRLTGVEPGRYDVQVISKTAACARRMMSKWPPSECRLRYPTGI